MRAKEERHDPRIIFECPRCPFEIGSDDILYLATEVNEHGRHCSGLWVRFLFDWGMFEALAKEGQL